MTSIYVYDSNQWGLGGIVDDHSLQVSSVSDMVEKVLTVTKKERYRCELTLGGGGRANFQSVGAGENPDQTGDRSLQLNGWGDLLGSAAVWMPKLSGQLYKLSLRGVDDKESDSLELMFAIGKILGTGVAIYGNHSYFKYYGDRSEHARRPTGSATLDRNALKSRLSQYTSK